jgi:zinc protease
MRNNNFPVMKNKLIPYLIACALLFLCTAVSAGVKIEYWKTGSGARVYFVENHSLPILDLSIDFSAGGSYDEIGRSGVASFTNHMLDTGADGLSEEEIARRLADVGALMGGHFDSDRAGVTLRTLSSERERNQSLDILKRVIQRPEFPEKILEREKARAIVGLREAETQPESIVSRAFYRALYGKHPYGNLDTVESVSAIKRNDLVDFYRRYYSADRAVIAIMGDISKDEAQRIAETMVAQIPTTSSHQDIPSVAIPKDPVLEKIAHPAAQAHILIGYPGITRDDPDYFSLVVGNYILGGGGFSSRLLEEVREKRGLVYSVHSYFLPLKQSGPFQIGLQTRKEEADAALKVVKDVLNNFLENGPTVKELNDAKSNIIGGFPLRIDSNREIVNYLALIGFYQLPLTYLDDYPKKVEKLTVNDIKSAFKRRIDPQRLVTIIVGGENNSGNAKQ